MYLCYDGGGTHRREKARPALGWGGEPRSGKGGGTRRRKSYVEEEEEAAAQHKCNRKKKLLRDANTMCVG